MSKASKTETFSSDVVDPFTKKPYCIKDVANGFPNQPHPKILILFKTFYFKD